MRLIQHTYAADPHRITEHRFSVILQLHRSSVERATSCQEPPMTTPDQPTVQQSVPQHPIRPPVNAGWAVVSLLFFWPLSFSAFTHAFNVYPLWADGDVAGSRYASDRVKRLGQISLWIAGGLLLLVCILYAIAAIVWFANGGHDYGPRRMR
jgi:hypothetical protein